MKQVKVQYAKTHLSALIAAVERGEEFVIVLPETDGPSALQVAESLRREVETLLVCVGDEGQEVAVTVSIGVATLHQGSGMSFEELVNRADQALYQAKGTGRNAVYCADMPPAEGGVGEQVPLDLGGGGAQP